MSGKRMRAALQVFTRWTAPARDRERARSLDGLRWLSTGARGYAAYNQVQFDILGAIVDCVFEHTRSRDSLSERSWRIVVQAVETSLKCWKDPDRGIWEVRGDAAALHVLQSHVLGRG